MAVGSTPSKQDIDSIAGQLTRDINNLLHKASSINSWLAQMQDSDLTALGYNSTDIANLRSSFSDLNQLNTIFTGAANLTTAKDFRSYCRWLYGLGVN